MATVTMMQQQVARAAPTTGVSAVPLACRAKSPATPLLSRCRAATQLAQVSSLLQLNPEPARRPLPVPSLPTCGMPSGNGCAALSAAHALSSQGSSAAS